MKRLFAVALFALSSIAFGASLLPIAALDPIGSSTGQMVVSNGPSNPPSYSGTLPTLTISNALTSGATLTLSATSNSTSGVSILLLGNGTTTPRKFVNVFSGNFNILNNAGSANIFSLTDSGNATFAGSIQPSQTAGIIATNTNNNVNAGSVGEFAAVPTASTGLSNGVAGSATSVPLSAGEWDVECTATFSPAATTTVSSLGVGINTSSTAFATSNTGATNVLTLPFTTGQAQVISSPRYRMLLASTTTTFCVVAANFGVSTMTVSGYIRARRPR